jgi:hypothetical protein
VGWDVVIVTVGSRGFGNIRHVVRSDFSTSIPAPSIPAPSVPATPVSSNVDFQQRRFPAPSGTESQVGKI